MALDSQMVGASKVEHGRLREERSIAPDSLVRSGKIECAPLALADWRRLSDCDKCRWIRKNIQCQDGDEFRWISQIDAAMRPRTVLARCHGGPGREKQERPTWMP